MPIEIRKIVGIVENGQVVRGYTTQHVTDENGQETQMPRDIELTAEQIAVFNEAGILTV